MPGHERRIPLPHTHKAAPAAKRVMKKHIARFLEEVSLEAAQHIYDTMRDPAMPPDLRLRAAFDIMDRTQGKPVNKVEQRVIDDVDEQRTMPNLENVPTDKLESILKQLEQYQQPDQIEGSVISTEGSDISTEGSDISTEGSDISTGEFDLDG